MDYGYCYVHSADLEPEVGSAFGFAEYLRIWVKCTVGERPAFPKTFFQKSTPPIKSSTIP
jgi:hypothetical protein